MSKMPARYTREALEDETDLGPAMQSLNSRQRGFVMAKFDLMEANQLPTDIDCARAAGYEGTDKSLKVQAHKLAYNVRVLAAIKEEAERRCINLLPLAHRRMTELVIDRTHKDHFQAIKHQQALSGFSPKQVHVVEHVHDKGALIQEIKGSLALLRGLGIKVTEELIPIEAQDAEFEDASEEHSDEGIEDLI